MIEVRNLTKRYGDKTALDGLSFTVGDGEVLGLLGPNGAGKTTTMNIMTGYLSSDAGTVTVDGHEILAEPRAVKSRIGYLPEQPPLYPDMTVKDYLSFMFDLKRLRAAKAEKAAQIEGICARIGITEVYARLIKNLSKGYRQRVGLAQALLGSPRVLILDEPTVGLDPRQIIDIRTLIRDLGKEHTVILSSHILSEVQAVCERVAVISHGVLVASGTPGELSARLSGGAGLHVRIAGPPERVGKFLRELPGVGQVNALEAEEPGALDFLVVPKPETDIRRELFTRLAKRDWPLLYLQPGHLSLEEAFLQLTTAENGARKEGGDEA